MTITWDELTTLGFRRHCGNNGRNASNGSYFLYMHPFMDNSDEFYEVEMRQDYIEDEYEQFATGTQGKFTWRRARTLDQLVAEMKRFNALDVARRSLYASD